MDRGYADLHIHSIYSDSSLSIKDIFNKAREMHLKCIALTDHDTTAGIKEAQAISKSYGIEFIKGIEFSAEQDDREVHVLGYIIDPESPILKDAVSVVKEVRKKRIINISQKMNSLGVKVDEYELNNTIGDAVPTRLHVALYMVKKGYVKSVRDAFKKYLSYGKPAYVSRFCYSVKEAIGIIKKSGGLAILAHPHVLPLKELMSDFVKWGIDGMEVIYPGYTRNITDKFSKIAEGYGILKSGGSDAHGIYKSFTSIGSVKIPYEWVSMMKERNSNILINNNKGI